MKMTVEIPDRLYRRAKIRAVEDGTTMRELVMAALERELSGSFVQEESVPYFAKRKVDPVFKRLTEQGVLSGGTDSTEAISEERDGR